METVNVKQWEKALADLSEQKAKIEKEVAALRALQADKSPLGMVKWAGRQHELPSREASVAALGGLVAMAQKGVDEARRRVAEEASRRLWPAERGAMEKVKALTEQLEAAILDLGRVQDDIRQHYGWCKAQMPGYLLQACRGARTGWRCFGYWHGEPGSVNAAVVRAARVAEPEPGPPSVDLGAIRATMAEILDGLGK